MSVPYDDETPDVNTKNASMAKKFGGSEEPPFASAGADFP
jgi:hypothetical protein